MFCTRREFIKKLGRITVAAGSVPALLNALGMWEGRLWADDKKFPEARHYKRLADNRVECNRCPISCNLADGETSECYTRKNVKGTLYTHAYNNPCIIKVDPIEKLPAHHFLPGEQTLTIATGGCNMRCLYCQNWQQSQSKPDELNTIDFTKEQAFDGAKEKGLKIIAYSYTEPMMFMEYVEDIAAHTKPKGIKNVIATAGYVEEKPLKDLCKNIDAITVGLKAFTQETYKRLTQRSLAPVIKTIETIKKEGVWLEITNLIVPTYNDERKAITEMCKWIKKNFGGDVPLHFARFVPMYKLKNLPQTPLKSLEEARQIALSEGIEYVYISNVAPHEGNDTYCSKCKKPLIKRVGLKILENKIKDGKCPFCNNKIPGVWK